MTLLPDHADAVFASVSSVLEGEGLNSMPRDEVLSIMEAVLHVARRAIAVYSEGWNAHIGPILPPELLGRCFEFLDFNDRLLASGISQHWRRVALSTPTLWASFSIFPERSEDNLKLDELLRRSQAVPLSMTLHGANHYDELLHQHLPRLRSLEANHMPETLDCPVLETLKVSTFARLGQATLGRSAQSLRVLKLCNFIIEPTCPAFRSLRQFEGNFGPNTDLARFLALCPQLRALVIRCQSSLGADPRPLFVALPHSLTDVSISGLFHEQNPELDPTGVWAGHRFRQLDISSLRDISSALRLFESALGPSDPGPGWTMEVWVDRMILYVLRTPGAETRITGPRYTHALAVEAITSLQKSQHHLARLTSLTVPLRYFSECVEADLALPALAELVLTVHPERDHRPVLPSTAVTAAMRVPRLQSFEFLCGAPAASTKDTVHLFCVLFQKRLRAWLRYDAERLQRMALVGDVPGRVLDELDYRGPGINSLAEAVHVGKKVWRMQ